MGEPADETDEAEGARLRRATAELQAEIDQIVSKHRAEMHECIGGWLQRQENLAKLLGGPASDGEAAPNPCDTSSTAGSPLLPLSGQQPSSPPPMAVMKRAPTVSMAQTTVSQKSTVTLAWSGLGAPPEHSEHVIQRGSDRPSPKPEFRKAQSIVPVFNGGGVGGRAQKAASALESRFGKSRKLRKKGTRVNNFLIQSKRDDALASMNSLQRITTSRLFEVFTGVLIAANAIFLGTQTQFNAVRAMDNADKGRFQDRGDPPGYVAMQVLFSIAFTSELILRWGADGFCEFFRGSEYSWNIFDIVVVSFSLFDVLALGWPSLSEQGLMGNTSILRVMRVVRIVRVARVIRIMRFFRELRMMIFALLGSFKSLCWALMILGMVFFMFGISITTGVVEYVRSHDMWYDQQHQALISWFGTLDRSFISLYMGMSGGRDWGEYYEALEPLPFQQRYLYLLFISFSNLAVVNIVTGIFVDSAMQSNQSDRDIIVQEEMAEKEAYLESMRTVFEEMDDDATGNISMEEFEKKLDDERVIAYFNALKLDASDARKLFYLLDFDQSGEIDIDEFLGGCHRLKGESRALDMAIMQYEVRWLSEAMGNLQEYLEKVLSTTSAQDLA